MLVLVFWVIQACVEVIVLRCRAQLIFQCGKFHLHDAIHCNLNHHAWAAVPLCHSVALQDFRVKSPSYFAPGTVNNPYRASDRMPLVPFRRECATSRS